MRYPLTARRGLDDPADSSISCRTAPALGVTARREAAPREREQAGEAVIHA